MHKNWRWNLHGHISMLPFTIGYAIWCLIVYRAGSWGFRNGVLGCVAPRLAEIFKGTGAQTIGGLTCFASEPQRSRDDLRVHENVHIVEAMICALVGAFFTPIVFAAVDGNTVLGLTVGGTIGVALYSLVYITAFAYFYFTTQKDEKDGWHDDYMRNFLEKIAYAVQAAYVANVPGVRAKAWK